LKELIFKTTEETINERKQTLVITMLMMVVITPIFYYVLAKKYNVFHIQTLIISFAVVISVVLIEILILSKIMFNQIRKMKLIITDNSIKRVNSNLVEEFWYQDIVKINIRRNRKDAVLYIKIKLKNKSVMLAGYENMNQIASCLEERMKDNSWVIEKQTTLNWNNPFLLILLMITITLLILGMIMINISIYKVFGIVMPIVIGLYMLIYRPITRNLGLKFRRFEVILSALTFVGVIFILIGYILQYVDGRI